MKPFPCLAEHGARPPPPQPPTPPSPGTAFSPCLGPVTSEYLGLPGSGGGRLCYTFPEGEPAPWHHVAGPSCWCRDGVPGPGVPRPLPLPWLGRRGAAFPDSD